MAEPTTLQDSPTGAAPPPPRNPAKRKRLFGILAAAVLAIGVIAAVWLLITSNRIGTDNAYVDADLVQVTPLFGGPVAAAYVSDTDPVKKGQILVLLDDADAKIALAQARADLGQVQRKVQGYFA